MPASPVKIGPFSGGLNSYSGPTSIGDNECIDIQNFDIDFDGALKSRPPVTIKDDKTTIPVVEGAMEILGWFIHTDMARYLIVTFTTGGVYARNEETGVWSTITTTIRATAMVQYANKAWLISNGANSGGSWSPSAGWVADADIPKGECVCIYKERLFIGGSTTTPNRVFFSNAADFGTWDTGVNFFDVRSGDGQGVKALTAFQDNVVCHKTDSTYVFSYDSNPSRGNVRLISGSVGIENKWCVVEYDNSLYVQHESKVYQLANWNFTLVNLKVPFEYLENVGPSDYDTYASLNVMTDRLICHHFDNIYVFNLRMGVWSKWAIGASVNFNRFVAVPLNDSSEIERYYGGCRRIDETQDNHVLYEWRPEIDGVRSEEMTCYVVTKTYDFNVPYTFKRLFHWGVDMLSQRDLTYTVHPVVYSPAVTHEQMSAFTHEELAQGSNLRPLSVSIDVSGSKSISNVSGARMFVKLIKSLRFRQIYFTVGGTTDGSTVTGPIQIYSIMAFVDNKQLVSKEVS